MNIIFKGRNGRRGEGERETWLVGGCRREIGYFHRFNREIYVLTFRIETVLSLYGIQPSVGIKTPAAIH
jgi:hypothetical protein